MSYRAYPDTKHNTGTFLSRESKMLRENFNIRDIGRRKPVLGEEGNNESRVSIANRLYLHNVANFLEKKITVTRAYQSYKIKQVQTRTDREEGGVQIVIEDRRKCK